jgi:hypothetical protein
LAFKEDEPNSDVDIQRKRREGEALNLEHL